MTTRLIDFGPRAGRPCISFIEPDFYMRYAAFTVVHYGAAIWGYVPPDWDGVSKVYWVIERDQEFGIIRTSERFIYLYWVQFPEWYLTPGRQTCIICDLINNKRKLVRMFRRR